MNIIYGPNLSSSLIVSPSTIDKMFEIYTFFENRTEIYTFFKNRFEIYTCILFENRTEILSMVDGLTISTVKLFATWIEINLHMKQSVH